MKRIVLGAVSAVVFALAGAASAASLVSLPKGGAGAFSLTANAQSGSGFSGAEAARFDITWSSSADGKSWTFAYKLDNTSTAGGLLSRVVAFGFDPTVDYSAVTKKNKPPVDFAPSVTDVTGYQAGTGGNFAGFEAPDLCFFSGQNCNGGGNTGVKVADAPYAGGFKLNYTVAKNAIDLQNFVVRWQSTGVNGAGSASGAATFVDDSGSPPPVGGVPEPATWAMMIGGLGLVGGAMRRRRALALA